MLMKAYSVMDVKAKAYNTPFFMAQDGMALRAFGDLVRDPKTSIHAHPEDYSLFHVGSFDDESGIMIAIDAPAYIGKAVDFVEQLPAGPVAVPPKIGGTPDVTKGRR